jgi:hypothetical protein
MARKDPAHQEPATRLQAQVSLVEEGMRQLEPPRRITVDPPDWRENDDLDYLYEEGVVLVRDEDLPRVLEQFRGLAPAGDRDGNLIDGLTLLSLENVERDDRSVRAILEESDRELGVGVMTPNHVLHVSPGGTICPAIEPEVPPGRDPAPGPDPDVCPDKTSGKGVLLSVVDTGLLETAPDEHAWLKRVTGDIEDPRDGGNVILPYAGHGTFVAGVARCMAPASDVIVERMFVKAGAILESDAVTQLDQALDNNPDVISLSAGTRSRKNLPLRSFEVFWAKRLRHYKGVQLVAAAGNDGNRGPFWPAAFPWSVSVGALSANWHSRAHFSNHGGWVDVYAPGDGLVNAYATGTFVCQEPPNTGQNRQFDGMARWSGTSFSTPLVAGLIAARMSRTGENGRQAAARLLAMARAQALAGVGAVLYPCDHGDHRHHPEPCGCDPDRSGRCPHSR